MSVRAPAASALAAFQAQKQQASKKKRLSSAKPLQDVTGSSNIQLNDDETEKAQLRAEKARQANEALAKQNEVVTAPLASSTSSSSSSNKRRSLGGKALHAVAPGVDRITSLLPPPAPAKPMDLKALGTLFTHCLKLATTGKINSKNTWDLDFIRHMGSMLLHPKDGEVGGAPQQGKRPMAFDDNDEDALMMAGVEENQFQKASCSLDAGMMIYSTRVDDVHKSTFKVLGGLSNGGAAGGLDDADEGADEAIGANGEVVPKKKKTRSKAGLSTLEPVPSKLDARLLETEVEQDPLFHLTTAKFEGGPSGMLMNNLAVYSGVRLCLDSSEEYVLAPRPNEPAGTLEKVEAMQKVNLDLTAFATLIADRLANTGCASVDQLRLTPAVDYFTSLKAELLAGGDGSGVAEKEREAEGHLKKKTTKKAAAAAAAAVVAPAAVELDLPTIEALPSLDADFEKLARDAAHSGEFHSSGGGGGYDDDGGDDDDQDAPAASSDLFSSLVSAEVAQLDVAIRQEERLVREMERAAAMDGLDPDDDQSTVAGGSGAAGEVNEDGESVASSSSHARRAGASVDDETASGGASSYGLLDGLEDDHLARSNWAGLKHWKFAATKRGAAVSSAGAVKGKKGAKRAPAKPKDLLDFTTVVCAPVAPAKPPTEAGRRGLQSAYPTTPGERRTRVSELQLPEDRFYRLRNLQTLCGKPNVMVKLRRSAGGAAATNATNGKAMVDGVLVASNGSKQRRSSGGVRHDADGGDDDGSSGLVPSTPVRLEACLQIVPTTSHISPFGADAGVQALNDGLADGPDGGPASEAAAANQLQFDDGANNDDDDDDNGGGSSGFGDDGPHGGDDDDDDANPSGDSSSSLLSLIASVQRAEKIDVKYAKVSTTVDVKALKAAMWSGVGETQKPVLIDAQSSVALPQTTFQSAISSVARHFPRALAHQLPDVSISYCFISMLHLCNEHGLTLMAPGANSDGASANYLPSPATAMKDFAGTFQRTSPANSAEPPRQTCIVVGEKAKQTYYLGDFLVRGGASASSGSSKKQ